MTTHLVKRDRYELLFRHILEEGVESGEFVEQDVGLAVKAILGMSNSVVRWYRPGGAHTPEEIGAELAQFVVRGAAGTRTAPRAVESAK